MKFKVGDRVQLTTEAKLRFPHLKGNATVVSKSIFSSNSAEAVSVLFDNDTKSRWFYEKRLQPIAGQLLFSFME